MTRRQLLGALGAAAIPTTAAAATSQPPLEPGHIYANNGVFLAVYDKRVDLAIWQHSPLFAANLYLLRITYIDNTSETLDCHVFLQHWGGKAGYVIRTKSALHPILRIEAFPLEKPGLLFLEER